MNWMDLNLGELNCIAQKCIAFNAGWIILDDASCTHMTGGPTLGWWLSWNWWQHIKCRPSYIGGIGTVFLHIWFLFGLKKRLHQQQTFVLPSKGWSFWQRSCTISGGCIIPQICGHGLKSKIWSNPPLRNAPPFCWSQLGILWKIAYKLSHWANVKCEINLE